MSSVTRVKGQNMGLVSKYANVSTPCYPNSDLGEDIPIPFTVQNGIIDIDINNASVQTFVDNGNQPGDDSYYQAKSMGGYRLANRIGTNFATYLRNYINATDISGFAGPLNVYVAATTGKVQIAQPNDVSALEFENVFGVNDQPPVSDSFAGGDATLNYFTTFVFYSPLTIQYPSTNSATGYKYITFTTHWDGN